MAAHYIELAVDSLHDRFVSRLEDELTIVEGEAGLSAGDLAAPGAYYKYPSPRDNVSPLIQVYDRPGVREISPCNGPWSVPCAVILSYSGDADIGATRVFVRRYITAMLRVVSKDHTLGGTVIQAFFTSSDSQHLEGDLSSTRHHYALGFDVHVQEREAQP